ncbi:MAG TPA: DNA topoisomerase IV subunit A [Alphaproteobacteria bacterium]|nr:DNA topoisomerase IV subunit A [Alphaproteobacteria bacterium]
MKTVLTVPTEFNQVLSEKYLAYALSTITSRSLPDVRDGLKPVHRRLLWAMYQLKLDPKSGYKKCARVVGDVIGKFHPHGDVAVYDALVRLAQDFSVRYPLVEGQGNFGSIDGDNPAAMRYTEARLTESAMLLLENIENDTVDFKPTYDTLDEEPVLLPAYFPNLLANGSEGIAVGMATAIPPHNVDELCSAILHLIKKPNAEIIDLLEFVEGPDFPTGGLLSETKEAILNSYTTGRGSFRLRAKWHKEDLSHGQYQIIITEIPYQVQKSKLLEKIAENFDLKKTPLLGNIRDESAENIRIILEPKNRSVEAEILMESLFRSCELEIRYSMNLNALDMNGMPKVMNLKDILLAYIEHQKIVLTRKTKYRLSKIADRLEILKALLVAYLNIDEVIRIIREEDEPKQYMMKKFKLTEFQVEAILNMRLRQLRKLEEIEIKRENDELVKEQKYLQELLSDESLMKKEIADKVKDIKNLFSKKTKIGKRRTEIINKQIENNVISIEAFIEKEPITINLSKLGWLRAFKGHNVDVSAVKYKDDDEEFVSIKANTTDKFIVFTTSGKFYTIGGDKIPGGKGFGDPIRLLADIPAEDEIINFFLYEPEVKYLLITYGAVGFAVKSEDLLAQTKSGKQVLNLKEKDKVYGCYKLDKTHIATVGENRKMLVIPATEIPEMKKGQGVTIHKFKEGKLSDIAIFNANDGLKVKVKNKEENIDIKDWLLKRASTGKLAPFGMSKNNKFLG